MPKRLETLAGFEGAASELSITRARNLSEIAPEVGSLLMRRILRPKSYVEFPKAIKEKIIWKKLNARISEFSQQTDDDFFVVQIGANDGVKCDPLHDQIVQHAWSGLLVEPITHCYKRLQENYCDQKNLAFANVAIADHEGKATMIAAKELPGGRENPLQPMSSFDIQIIDKHSWMAKSPYELVEPVEVKTMRLGTLLDEHSVERIDYLAVDTEGHDKVVLDQLDLDKYLPQFILYEHTHLQGSEQRELADRFAGRGYNVTRLRRDTFAELAS